MLNKFELIARNLSMIIIGQGSRFSPKNEKVDLKITSKTLCEILFGQAGIIFLCPSLQKKRPRRNILTELLRRGNDPLDSRTLSFHKK